VVLFVKTCFITQVVDKKPTLKKHHWCLTVFKQPLRPVLTQIKLDVKFILIYVITALLILNLATRRTLHVLAALPPEQELWCPLSSNLDGPQSRPGRSYPCRDMNAGLTSIWVLYVPSCGTFLSYFFATIVFKFPRTFCILYAVSSFFFDFMTRVEPCSLTVETQGICLSTKSSCVGPCDLIGNNKFYSWARFMRQINALWRTVTRTSNVRMPKDCSSV
jgi:hypothetical protein